MAGDAPSHGTHPAGDVALHGLLERQLGRLGLDPSSPPDPERWRAFLARIAATYADGDRERYVHSRAMRIASREMEELAARVTAASQNVAAERDDLAAVLGSLGHAVMVVHPNGVIASANPEALQLLHASDLVGLGLWDVVLVGAVDGLAWGRDDLTGLVGGATSGYSGVVRVTVADGHSFVADLAVRSLGARGDRACAVVMRDVTDVWRAGHERAALERLSRAVVTGTPASDLGGQVAAELTTLFGLPAAVLRDADAGATPHHDDATRVGTIRQPIVVEGERWGVIAVDTPADAEDAGEIGGSLERFAEVVALAVASDRARRSLVKLASTDALTGLQNIRAFRERLDEELELSRRTGVPLTLAMLDIDHFKDVNDQHGHPVGDAVLADVARRLTACGRHDDCLARVGGEEFAWLMPHTDVYAALEAAERARGAVRDVPFTVVGNLTASIGVAAHRSAWSADDLISHADTALYWAKRHGRDAAFPYTDELAALTRPQPGDSGGAFARDLLEAARDHRRGWGSRAFRVASLADSLAEGAGWSGHDRTRLFQACLVHDLTNGGVDFPGDPRWRRAELAWVAAHRRAGLAAAAALLDDEQAAWMRERTRPWCDRDPGESAGDRPGGECILAVADLWDTLVTEPPIGSGHTHKEALGVIAGHAGVLLCPRITDHLPAALARVAASAVGDGI